MFCVVVNAPLLDEDVRFFECIEYLPVQKFVTNFAIEAFNIPVLPRRTCLNISRLRADGVDPPANSFCNTFRPIVVTDIFGNTAQNE